MRSGVRIFVKELRLFSKYVTSASQFGARKKGVELRSFGLNFTTRCRVLLKAPLLYLKQKTVYRLGIKALGLINLIRKV